MSEKCTWLHRSAYFNGHSRCMKTMREENAFSQQPLVSCAKLDFGDGEGVAQMEGSVHVGVWEVAEPLGVLFLDLGGRQALQLLF